MDGLFDFVDYKEYLKARVRTARTRGLQSEIARAIRCQPSFLSKVLSGKVHLTPDHAVLLAHHWKMTHEEAEYFRELVQLGRASTPVLRQVIEGRLANLKAQSLGSIEESAPTASPTIRPM